MSQPLPVMVFCPLKDPQATGFSGTWTPRPDAIEQQAVVGCLGGYMISRDEDVQNANRDLAAHGVEVRWITQQARCAEGSLACVIAPGIFVETIEQAKALPGFAPIFWIAGPAEKMKGAAA